MRVGIYPSDRRQTNISKFSYFRILNFTIMYSEKRKKSFKVSTGAILLIEPASVAEK